jgi:hypothetical protein
MEARMSIRTLTKLALLALASAVIPACGSSDKNQPPFITFVSPPFGANTSRQPIIYVRWDRALDPATVNGTNVQLGVVGGSAVGATVTYHAPLNEIRILPTAALGNTAGPSIAHRVLIGPGVMSSTGISAGPTQFFDFNVVSSADDARPAFGGLDTVDNATQTSLQLNWAPEATDVVSFDHYDIFLATTTGTEDLTVRHTFTTGTSPFVVGGLTANTQYFFIVRAVDAAGNNDGNTVEVAGTTLP